MNLHWRGLSRNLKLLLVSWEGLGFSTEIRVDSSTYAGLGRADDVFDHAFLIDQDATGLQKIEEMPK